MATHTLDIAQFRLLYPAYADETAYPDAVIQGWFNNATIYVSANDSWGGLNGAALDLALQLLTAHLLYLFTLANKGKTGKIISATTIDKVAVTLVPPPQRGQWEYWLQQSPYGQQLLALLSNLSAGGFSIGGLPERSGFRRVGGGFGGPRGWI